MTEREESPPARARSARLARMDEMDETDAGVMDEEVVDAIVEMLAQPLYRAVQAAGDAVGPRERQAPKLRTSVRAIKHIVARLPEPVRKAVAARYLELWGGAE